MIKVSGKLLYFYKNGKVRIYNEIFQNDFYLNKCRRQLEKNGYECSIQNFIVK